MGKFLLLVLVGVIVYLLWVGVRRPGGRPENEKRITPAERMVDCSQCGLHLPQSEAIESNGRFFCSQEHRRLFVQ